jgi:MFS family permease
MMPKNVKNYLSAVFLITVSYTIIRLAVPLYMNHLGLSLSTIGIIFTIAVLPALLFQVYIGHLSDIFGRKKLFLALTAVVSLGSLFFAFSQKIWSFIAGKLFVETAENMRGAVSEPIMIDLYAKKKIGRPYGLLIAVLNIAFFIGFILTGFIIEKLGYPIVFLICVLISLVSLLIFSFFKEPQKQEKLKFSFKDISFKLKLVTFFMFLIVFGSSILNLYAFPIFLRNTLLLSVSTIGLIVAFGALGCGAGGLFGSLGDRFGFKKVNLVFLTLSAVCIVLISLFTNYLVISTLWFIQAFFGGVAFSTFGHFKRAASLPHRRGRDLSITRFGNITGTICASFFAGILIQWFGFTFLLFMSALSFIAAGIILTAFFK